MKKFKFKKIDAFNSQKSGGNPAGAIYIDSFDDISVKEMQRIAGELKGFVSEVGYVQQTGVNTFSLKILFIPKRSRFLRTCHHRHHVKPAQKQHRINPDSIAKALKIDIEALNRNYPVSTVNSGLGTLIVPVKIKFDPFHFTGIR